MQEKSKDELLTDLHDITETLKASLPTEAPLFFSKAIDPARALHLREACFHRITELAESAYEAFKKNNVVTGCLLTRAIMETVALFWYFYDKIEDAVNKGDLEQRRDVLTRMLVGIKIKAAQESLKKVFDEFNIQMPQSLAPINVLDLIRHVREKVPGFADQYDFLSEIAHPNAMGLIDSYVKNDWGQMVTYFGKEHGKLGSYLESDLKSLIITLERFMNKYDESALLLKRYQEVCEASLESHHLPSSEPDNTK